MNCRRWLCAGFALTVLTLLLADRASAQNQPPAEEALFRRENLVAWCIVPFDSKKRGPAERAEMLKRLGFSRFAYDYRAEHIPTFDAEIEALNKQGIELTAWWFPQTLNAEAQQILAVLEKHKLKTQLWVMGGGGPTANEEERKKRIVAEAARIRPIAEAAAKIGCTVALYNHGNWFGEPENELAIIEELKLPNVGLVYNLHHGHAHLDRFAAVLPKLLPHLLCLNINGMDKDGEAIGRKILPLGQGELDLALLKTIVASGYRGPIGILGHTQDDAEARLQDNLDGLAWLVPQLAGKPAGTKPTPRTPVPARPKPADGAHGGHGGAAPAVVGAVLPADYDPQAVRDLVAAATQQGDARRGMVVYRAARFACQSCHQVGPHGGNVGPALSDVGKRLKPEEIAEAVLWPKRQVKPEYVAWRLLLTDGRTLQGYKRSETAAAIEWFDPQTQRTESIAKSDIDKQIEAGTLMPDGIAAAMTPAQRRDLVRLLIDLGRTPGLENEVGPADTPAEFVYDRNPLDSAAWKLWQHPVNRDRLYDFYLKEALFFRSQSHASHLLPAFPGMDGGKLGHWGNQNEETWKDGRWNQTDLGSVLCGVFRASGVEVPKGVCVRMGDMACCFDPQTLTYAAQWKGGFLKFSEIRHGFLDGLRPAGEMLPRPVAGKPQQSFEYHGFYRLGRRVVFSYRIGDEEWLDSPRFSGGTLEPILAPASQHPLRTALKGGPAQWPEELTTKGELGTAQPYAVDTIQPPFDNPWKALLFFSDHDFLPDGTAVVATMTGDVWRVSGLDDKLQNVRWRRFASGLHQPLGLVVSAGKIYVLGRDQITRLVDLNNDGEADFYECFSNQMQTSPAGHDFTSGLARDNEGRFITASGKQGLLRILPGGRQIETLATGFRNPDGLGLLPDGSVTVPCSEGDWTPASMICLVPTVGRASGRPVPHFGYQGPKNGQPPALPMVYLPRGLDNSSGGQAVVADERFGPLAGQIIHLSSGQGTHFLVLRDEVGGQPQGAVVPLPGEFRSGANRAKHNPADGQLYVTGLSGWGTYTPDDGCFHRVRYTGGRGQFPKSLHIHENGLLLSFTEPFDRAAIADSTKHFSQVWNYRYSSGYGSPELAPSHPGVVGHERLEIAGVHPIDDRTLFVELPDLQPVNQLHLLLQVDAGKPQQLFVTVHKLDRPFTRIPGYTPSEKLIAAHPQAVDLALLGKTIPNPWGKRGRAMPTALLEIAAGKNLTYSTRLLRAKAGERVQLTFTNPDVVPHNWVLVKPNSLSAVGDLANKLIADPEAVLRHYVPKSDDVLVYSDIVPPQQSQAIWFDAPREKGRYPYLCTFPGHWMVMNGELIVE